jgi:hypothetical protein
MIPLRFPDVSHKNGPNLSKPASMRVDPNLSQTNRQTDLIENKWLI